MILTCEIGAHFVANNLQFCDAPRGFVLTVGSIYLELKKKEINTIITLSSGSWICKLRRLIQNSSSVKEEKNKDRKEKKQKLSSPLSLFPWGEDLPFPLPSQPSQFACDYHHESLVFPLSFPSFHSFTSSNYSVSIHSQR